MKKYIVGFFVVFFIFFAFAVQAQTPKKTELESLRDEVNTLKLELVWKDSIEKIIAKTLKEEKAKVSTKADIDLLIKELREVKKTRNENIESSFSLNKVISYGSIFLLLVLFVGLLFYKNKNNRQPTPVNQESITVDNRYLIGGGILFILIVITFMMNRLYIADVMQSELNNLITERELLRNTNLEGQTYDKVISLDNKMEAYKLELQRQNDRIEILAWTLGGVTFFALIIGLYEFVVVVRQRLKEAIVVNETEITKILEESKGKLKSDIDESTQTLKKSIDDIEEKLKKNIEEKEKSLKENIETKEKSLIQTTETTFNQLFDKELKPKMEELIKQKPELLRAALTQIHEELSLKEEMNIQVFSWKYMEEGKEKTNEQEVKEFFTQMGFSDVNYNTFDKEKVDEEKETNMLVKINEINSSNTIIFLNNIGQEGNEFNKILDSFDKNDGKQKRKAFFCLTPFGTRFTIENVQVSNNASSLPALYNNLIDLMRYKKNIIDSQN